MKKSIFPALALAGALLLGACSKDENTPALNIPKDYDGTNFATNAAAQIGVVNGIAVLTAEMQKGRSGALLSRPVLENLYTAGSPSVALQTTTYYRGRLEGNGGWFDEMAKASGGRYTPGTPNGTQGGVFGGYLFDENGLEIEQLVEKGLFGAALYNHAVGLISAQNITPATVDQLLAVYGATPTFTNSGSNNVAAAVRDRAMANYAARRDRNDGNGLYAQLKTQFIKLQAALKAGNAYNKDRDAAIAEIKILWEKVNAATIINYCHSATSTLSQTSPTEAQRGAALHAIGEAIGFIHGWRTIPQAHKKITDAQIDQVLVLLNAPQNGTPTVYKFATEPLTELSKLQQVITQLQNLYGFTPQQVEEFKNNWVAVQNR